MKKRTKIVATVGPSCDTLEALTKLIKAGVNVFRLNFSHGTHEYHADVLKKIREASKNLGLIVGVLQDISGPKIRIGELESRFLLSQGDILEFVKENIVGIKIKEGHYRLSINQPDILKKVELGEYIYLYDGIIRSKVIEKDDEGIKVRLENDGILSSKKGVNFPQTEIGIDILTEKDKKDMAWGVANGVDFMAISFVQNAEDMRYARELIKEFGDDIRLYAKIEKFDAVENIDEIIDVSDGIMVARGDLGIEIPYYEVPHVQKMIIKKANALSKPVITATQMLLSMTTNDTATRAEISDVANAVLDGTDAVMLSEESAIGHDPELAVKTMFNTIVATEKNYPFYKLSTFAINDFADRINESASILSKGFNSASILTITSSGNSAQKIARYRPDKPIYAITHDEKISRALTIVWGVIPTFYVEPKNIDDMIYEVVSEGLKRKILTKRSDYILTAGTPVGVSHSTNMIRLISHAELDKYT
jgi:pyruvate kinase